MNVTKPGPGGRGTIRTRTYYGEATWRQRKAMQRQRYGKHATELVHLVCNGPARFHGGAPFNRFTAEAQRPRLRP